MPEQTAEAAGGGIVLWPLVLVIVAALVLAWIAWQRRSAWRREIVQQLNTIEQSAGNGNIRDGWDKLALLLRRIAVGVNRREDVAGLVGEAWLERLDQLFDTDMFSHGPGRGVAVYPYVSTSAQNGDPFKESADQLKTTIDTIRAGLTRLKAVS